MERVFGVFAPVIGGANNKPMTERLFSRCGKEAVNIAFLHPVIFCIEFTLDGMEFICSGCFSHQVYACIPRIYALFTRPISVNPNLAVQIFIASLIAEVRANQVFKIRAFFPC